MFLFLRRNTGLIVFIAIIAALLFGVGNSRSFQNCIDKTPIGSAPTLLVNGRAALECSGDFFTSNQLSITTFSTLLLVLVTGGLVWFGWRQVATTRSQLRAYIGVDEMREPKQRTLEWEPRGTSGAMYVIASAINHGTTPALNVEYDYHLTHMYGLPGDETIRNITYKGRGVLQPSQEMILRIEAPASREEHESIENGFSKTEGYNAWIYGFVSYFDIYGDKHYTRYCFCLDFNNGSRKIPGWNMYRYYNDTDDQTPGIIVSAVNNILNKPFRWGIHVGSIVSVEYMIQ